MYKCYAFLFDCVYINRCTYIHSKTPSQTTPPNPIRHPSDEHSAPTQNYTHSVHVLHYIHFFFTLLLLPLDEFRNGKKVETSQFSVSVFIQSSLQPVPKYNHSLSAALVYQILYKKNIKYYIIATSQKKSHLVRSFVRFLEKKKIIKSRFYKNSIQCIR
jgi:hypothetical protein